MDSPLVARRNDLHNMNESFHLDPGLHAEDIQQQILKVRRREAVTYSEVKEHCRTEASIFDDGR